MVACYFEPGAPCYPGLDCGIDGLIQIQDFATAVTKKMIMHAGIAVKTSCIIGCLHLRDLTRLLQ